MIDLYERYTNTLFNASLAVYRNVFALVADIDDYKDEMRHLRGEPGLGQEALQPARQQPRHLMDQGSLRIG